MSTQQLRDKNQRLLGTLRTLHDGRIELRNAGGGIMGTYYPSNETTRDANGGVFGYGNILALLLAQ